ncbi:MAG: hypothetical protein GY712_05370 [Oceanicoccus sp.]|uniref:cytochrome b n=1 Tax=Oceanicoccus sp. TaxID=2691044 RepID=UPI00261ADEFD|nr:cytochrome b/b6 domain-containing protein [Oceanicoccus sp.]MCP3907430.1 hypothetical protein [Oceanicoccus sp.]
MLDPDTKKTYGVTSAILAWLVFFSFTITLVISISWPLMNVVDPDRDFYRAMHMTLGVVSFVFVALRLLWWAKNPRPQAPKRMTENAYGLSRLTLLFLYISVLGLSVSGFMNSWAIGYEVSLFGLFTLPILEGWAMAFASSAHNIFVLFNYGMLLAYLMVFVYHALRYKVGFRRMIPGMHV